MSEWRTKVSVVDTREHTRVSHSSRTVKNRRAPSVLIYWYLRNCYIEGTETSPTETLYTGCDRGLEGTPRHGLSGRYLSEKTRMLK